MSQYEELKSIMEELTKTQQRFMGRTQAGATMTLARFSDSLMRDETDLEKWRIIESMTAVPRQNFLKLEEQAFSVEPAFGGKTLTRGELAFLAQSGVKGLLETGAKELMNEELESRSLELELKDQKKACAFWFQFLAFKPRIAFINQALDEDFQLESIYHEEATIPRKLVFTINFFDFPLLHTEEVIFENGADQFALRAALQNQHPFLLMRQAYLQNSDKELKEPLFKFEIEPSSSTNPFQHVKETLIFLLLKKNLFCQYLYRKCATIEIWDSESLLVFGTVKVPLKVLMRQGKASSTFTKNVDILDPSFGKVRGQLQLLVRNIGRHDRVQESVLFQQPEKPEPTVEQIVPMKRKVLSNKPLDSKNVLIMTAHTQPFLDAGATTTTTNNGGGDTQLQQFDPEERIKERIRRFKLARFSQGIDEKDTAAQMSAKQAQLNEINKFKEQQKTFGIFIFSKGKSKPSSKA